MSYSWGASRDPVRAGRVPAGRSRTLPKLRPAAQIGVGTIGVGVGATGRLSEAASPAAGKSRGEVRRLVAELTPMVDVWWRLLVQHVPDRTGRCRLCTEGGTGLPAQRWPCSLHGIARRRHGGDCR